MSINEQLRLLNKDFAEIVIELLQKCLVRDISLCLWEGLRNPYQQGLYWSASRSLEEIQSKIDELNEIKACFLANCIGRPAPFPKKIITNAIPGFSWHQWGEAIDLVWIVNNKVCWDTNIQINGINGYQVLAMEASDLGLESGFYWQTLKDACHIQMRKESPFNLFTVKYIDEIMYERFVINIPKN